MQCINIRASHRLLAKHILARLHRRDTHRRMEIVMQAHINRLDLGQRQQIAEIRETARDAMLGSNSLDLGLVEISDRHDLNIRHRGVCGHMALADLPKANHADLHFVCHDLPPYCKGECGIVQYLSQITDRSGTPSSLRVVRSLRRTHDTQIKAKYRSDHRRLKEV